jgi:hypothetical protein
MRKNYISPEFTYNTVYGTFNMKEESSFFGSKMLEVEDSISISDVNLIYYQSISKEQIDLSTENTLTPIIYNVSSDKLSNHTIKIDETQTQYDLNNNTKWIIDINVSDILVNYLFATLKQARTFEGVKNSMTIYNDVDFAMKEYIKTNVLNRYKFSKIELYLKYNDLRDQNVLRYKNVWNQNTIKDGSNLKKIQTETAYDYSTVKVKFSQEQPSSKYIFDYYFSLFFEKI